MGLVKKMAGVALLFVCVALAQGFGGDQSTSGSMEYSQKFADVNYADDGKTYHALDIYLPKVEQESYPVVIHTYGSAWSMNNYKGSADLNTICAALLKAGYAVVTPNHRSASDSIYPAQLHDLKAVVRFVRGSAAKYKFDTNFVAMSGFSSGAHLSSLTATTCDMKTGSSGSVTVDLEGSLGKFTSFSSCIDAASLWSPPTDIYTMNPINNFIGSGTYEGAFIGVERSGNEDRWKVASSPYYASEDDPPIILFHGTSDQIVNFEQSQELYDSLQKHNVVSELVKVSGGTHGGTEMYVSENLNKMVAFFDEARLAKMSAQKVSNSVNPVDTNESADNYVQQDSTAKNLSGAGTFQNSKVQVVGNVLYATSDIPNFSYRIYAVDGSVSFRGWTRNALNLANLESGTYCIVISFRNGSKSLTRFVKR